MHKLGMSSDDDNGSAEGALSRAGRGAWGLSKLVASVLAAAAAVISVFWGIALFAAAYAMTDLNSWVQTHKRDVANGRQMMAQFVRDDIAFKRLIAENQWETCRHTPGARCTPVIIEKPQIPDP